MIKYNRNSERKENNMIFRFFIYCKSNLNRKIEPSIKQVQRIRLLCYKLLNNDTECL